MSTFTAAGDFQFRTIYSLLCQQDGQMQTGEEWLAGDNKDKLTQAVDGRIQLGEGRPCARLHRISCGDRAVHVG